MATTIVIKTQDGEVVVKDYRDDMQFTDFMADVVVPAIGAIYSHKMVAEWVRGDAEKADAFDALVAALNDVDWNRHDAYSLIQYLLGIAARVGAK